MKNAIYLLIILLLTSQAQALDNSSPFEEEKVVSFHCKSTDDVATHKFNGMIQMTLNNYSKITKAVMLIEVQKAGNEAKKEIITANNLYGKFEVFPEGTLYNQEVTLYNLRDEKDLPSNDNPIRGQITGDINHFLSSRISIGDWVYYSKCEK